MSVQRVEIQINANDEASGVFDHIAGRLSSLGGGVKSFMSGAAQFAAGGLIGKGLDLIGGAISGVKDAMIGGNAEFERYQTQFGVLMGGADKAKERLAMLAEFGAKTPFELPELVKADKVLLSFGLHSKTTAKKFGVSGEQILTTIGDIAAGTGVGFEELSLTFGKFASGATGEAIARFQELGIATREQMASWGLEFSKSGQLLTPVDKAFGILEKNVRAKFGGMMDAQSSTFEGMVSNFQDWLGQVGRMLGAPIFDALKTNLAGLLAFLGSDAVKGAISGMAAGIATGITQIIGFLQSLASYIPPISAAFQFFSTAIQQAFSGENLDASSVFLYALEDMGVQVTPLIKNIVFAVEDGFYKIGEIFKILSSSGGPLMFFEAFAFAITGTSEAVEPFTDTIGELAKALGLGNAGYEFAQTITLIGAGVQITMPMIESMGASVQSVFGSLIPIALAQGMGAWNLISTTIQTAIVSAISIVQTWLPVVQTVLNGIALFLTAHGAEIQLLVSTAWTAVTTIIQTAIDTVTVVINALAPVVLAIFGQISTFLNAHGSEILGFLTTSWTGIHSIITTTLTIIKVVATRLFGEIAAFIDTHSDTIQRVLSGAWVFIQKSVNTTLNDIKTLAGVTLAIAEGDWDTAWSLMATSVEASSAAMTRDITSMDTALTSAVNSLNLKLTDAVNALDANLAAAANTAAASIGAAANTAAASIGAAFNSKMTEMALGVSATFSAIGLSISGWFTQANTDINTGVGAIALAWNTFWASLSAPVAAAWLQIQTDMAAAWGAIVTALAPVWESIKTAVGIGIEAVKLTLLAALGAMSLTWKAAWALLVQPVIDTWLLITSTVVDAAAALGVTINGWLTEIGAAMDTAWDAMSAKVSEVWLVISSAISAEWKKISDGINTAVNKVKADVSAAWDAVSTKISGVLNTIGGAISSKWSEFVSSISAKNDAASNDVNTKWSAIENTIGETASAIERTITQAWDSFASAISIANAGIQSDIATVWSAIQQWVNDKLSAILLNVSTTFSAISKTINDAIETAKTTIADGVEAFIGKFRDLKDKMSVIGQQLLEGMVQGIRDKVGWLVDEGVRAANAVLSAIKSTLGIRSPSVEGFETSQYLIEGLTNGIEQNADMWINAGANAATQTVERIRVIVSPLPEIMGNSMIVAGNVAGPAAQNTANVIVNAFSGLADDLEDQILGAAESIVELAESGDSSSLVFAKSFEVLRQTITGIVPSFNDSKNAIARMHETLAAGKFDVQAYWKIYEEMMHNIGQTTTQVMPVVAQAVTATMQNMGLSTRWFAESFEDQILTSAESFVELAQHGDTSSRVFVAAFENIKQTITQLVPAFSGGQGAMQAMHAAMASGQFDVENYWKAYDQLLQEIKSSMGISQDVVTSATQAMTNAVVSATQTMQAQASSAAQSIAASMIAAGQVINTTQQQLASFIQSGGVGGIIGGTYTPSQAFQDSFKNQTPVITPAPPRPSSVEKPTVTNNTVTLNVTAPAGSDREVFVSAFSAALSRAGISGRYS